MDAETAFHLEVVGVVGVAAVIVALAAVASGACGDAPSMIGRRAAGRARVDDVERALDGDATLVTYEEAAKMSRSSLAAGGGGMEAEEDVEDKCAICLSGYARADELVRVVPACGHFFHAGCGVERWLRKKGSCPLCRGGVLPPAPTPQCPPMPPRTSPPPPPGSPVRPLFLSLVSVVE